MWKLLIVSDKHDNSRVFKFAEKFFDISGSRSIFLQDSRAVIDLINHEVPHFVYLDFKTDLRADDNEQELPLVLKDLEGSGNLRITIFHLSFIKAALLKIFPLDFLDMLISIFFWRSHPGLSGKGRTVR